LTFSFSKKLKKASPRFEENSIQNFERYEKETFLIEISEDPSEENFWE